MKIKQTSALIAAVVGITFAGSALAADGTITINGQITDTTCSISVNGGNNNASLILPTVSTTALPTLGSVAGATPYSIALTGCTGAVLNSAGTFYEVGNRVDLASGRLNSIGTASNVHVELLNADLEVIKIGGTRAEQHILPIDISTGDGSGTMNFYARYYATDMTGATAGNVETQVDYSIVYD
ncbi:fimbrial protein [Edaphovirga cremea]|uniref:fimbrial protein n=1 Tax=Edaphovirga cremea TaxID=2267246 RepID=UPI000DEF0146